MGLRKRDEMAPCYSKNGILKGTVDFYCLVCETYLRSEADNIDHIAKPIHKKNLDSTQYVKGFEEDFVRKIKMGYFCEICNKLLPMMARVKIHVKEQSHIDGKNVMYFKRIGVNVIAFGKVVLNEKAWNGLNEESCAFCNTEYEDEDMHKNLLSHILNIIQIKVEVDENKNIYRKIDDVSFHCLTCNMVVALNDLTLHFEEDQHKHLYQKCYEISLNKTNELKENESNKEIEDQSEKVNDGLVKPLNNIEKKTEEVHSTGGEATRADVSTKCDVLKKTTAIDAISLNKIDENENQIAINSVVKEKIVDSSGNSKDSVAKSVDKTAVNKEESKTVNDVDVNIKSKNTSEKKVKNKATINPSQLNNTKKSGTTKTNSSFNIEQYEKKICKILRTIDYITLDENGKTLCILCDWIMDPSSKKIHVSGQHHQAMERMHKRRLAEMRDKNNNESTVIENKSILDLVSEFQANNVNINLIFNTAVCKKCSVNLPYDVNAIEEHILKHNNEINKHENAVILQSSEAIGKETCLKTNEVAIEENSNEKKTVTNQKDEKLTCLPNEINKHESNVILQSKETINIETCENTNQVIIEENTKEEKKNCTNQKVEKLASVKDTKENEGPISQVPIKTDEELLNETSLKDEVKGEVKIDEPLVSVTLLKQSLSTYVKTLTGVRHMIFSDIIINDIQCISLFSFNYLVSIKGEMKCLICDEEVGDCEAHINKFKHITELNGILVIINEKSEFVREIHPELFHCGFCNKTVSLWNKMQEHFNSSSHIEIKNAAGWRMQLYSNEIRTQNQINTFSEVSVQSVRNMFCGMF